MAAEDDRIADRYLTDWGGLDAGLPLLAARPELGDLGHGYGLRHLVKHLALAGRTADVHRLLACEQPPSGGRLGLVNVWYDARERAGQIDGYLDDLAVAADLARTATDASLAAGDPAPAFGLELRYALMAAAVRAARERTYDYSALRRHDPSVAPMFVEAGLWDITRALSIAARIGDARERTEAVRALLPYVPPGRRPRVLGRAVIDVLGTAAAEDLLARLPPEGLDPILDHVEREHADGRPDTTLGDLAPHLPQRLLPRALAIAAKLPDGTHRHVSLRALAPYLPPGLAVDALASARELTDPEHRAETLLELVPRLPEPARADTLAEAKATVARIDRSCAARRRIIGRLIALLPDHAHPEVLPRDPAERAEALTHAAGLMPAVERTPVLDLARAAARRIPGPGDRARALLDLAELVPVAEQARVLAEAHAAARRVDDPSYRGLVLAGLLGALPAPERGPVVAEALAAAEAVTGDRTERARLLMAVAESAAPPESDEILARALATARAEPDEGRRLTLLLEVAEPLTGTDRHEALGEAVELALGHIDDEERFSSILGRLAPVLPGDLMARVLTELADRGGPGRLGRVLVREGGRLTGDAHRVALAAARDLGERPSYQAAALAVLADRLPPERRAEVLEEAVAVARRDGRGLPQIARRLPASRRKALLAEELAFPRSVFNDFFNDHGDAALAAVVVEAQRRHREGAPPAVVIREIRAGLEHPGDLNDPSSATPASALLASAPLASAPLASAARTFAGPEAEREYRTALRDVHRWWADPLDRPGAGPLDRPAAGPLDRPAADAPDHHGAGPLDRPGAGPLDHPAAGPLDRPGAGP